ncbi:DNA helicase [Fusarium acutatum]|uniref:DNA helicase n=1 Tax=Fusarium acutatum TaxID=78861 RepID=A0A8H4JA48_9HYPO|nr:DNA helicase [Fusarium acutatum]
MTESSASGQKKAAVINTRDCVVFSGNCGSIIASSNKSFGTSVKLSSKLALLGPTDENPFFGFWIEFPLGETQADNEETGFGVRHQYQATAGSVRVFDQHTIKVRFPLGGCQLSAIEAPKSLVDRFPNVKNKDKRSVLTVTVSAPISVFGFGTPFQSPDAEVNGWVNDNRPIGDGTDLQTFLKQTEFTFLLNEKAADVQKRFDPKQLPGLFSYPYSTDQSWLNYGHLGEEARTVKGHQFAPAYEHRSDLNHVTAVVQGVAQDALWLDERSQEIALMQFPGYFVKGPRGLFLVVPLTLKFHAENSAAWRRLSKEGILKVKLWDWDDLEEAHSIWDAKIAESPNSILSLKDHPTEDHELVMFVRLIGAKEDEPHLNIVKTFDDRSAANLFSSQLPDCERKVDAANLFLPSADPFNFQKFGLPSDLDDEKSMRLEADMSDKHKHILTEVRDRMELHRALLRGQGFYDWMSKPAPRGIEEAMEATSLGPTSALRPLPITNFLEGMDEKYADAIVAEALPQDQARFRGYLEHRPLGLGIVTAGPGFGKTTAGAACALAMAGENNKILCSAPTNVAVYNFASRIDRRTRAIAARCNEGNQTGTPRVRHKLVVRCYKLKDEVKAFTKLLQDSKLGDDAAPNQFFKRPSNWLLHLSSTYWLLKVFRSPVVTPLHQDDHPTLHRWQKRIDDLPELADLRALIAGQTTWDAFEKSKAFSENMKFVSLYLEDIPNVADLLCATPAASQNDKRIWRFKLWADGVAVDEAANMTRADLLCVWGNTMSPCFLFGDPQQLPPTVMLLTDKWPGSLTDYINRFALDAKISALEYLQAGGIPVYRLKMQLRMGMGMFDTVSSVMYPDVPFTYDPSRAINFSDFKVGRDLESFALERYPDLTPAPKDTLKPFFIHCEGGRVIKNELSGSKRSFDQVQIALDFILDLVAAKKVAPSKISIVAPYAANVDLIKGLLKRSKYLPLQGIPSPSTIDSFQGQENDIIVAVLGTDEMSGPGFTADANRLNVMLTRAKCGLVLVGNIYVGEAVPNPKKVAAEEAKAAGDGKGKPKGKGKGKDKDKGKDKGKPKKEAEPTFTVKTMNGSTAVVKAPQLRKVYKDLYQTGRVAKVVVEQEDKGKGKENEGAA